MNKEFDINSGLLNVLRGLLHDGDFAHNVIELLLGDKNAPWALERALKQESYGQTLNEVVAIHRLLKKNLSESIAQDGGKDEGLLRKLLNIRKKSMKFQTQVVVKTLKKPGAVPALIKLVASEGTDAKSWAVLAPMVVDSAVDVAPENKEKTQEPECQEMPMNESAISNRLRRAFKHGSFSTGLISEGMEDSYGGRIPVNIYVGRFQPFHLGHLSNLEKAAEKGLRTVLMPVKVGTSAKSIKGHPFHEIDDEILERVKNSYSDLIIDVIKIKNIYAIEEWLPELRNRGYEPVALTTGEDRAPSYAKFIKDNKEKYGLCDNFELIVLDKKISGEKDPTKKISDISASLIRGEDKKYPDRYLRNPDEKAGEEEFKSVMPNCLWDMYGKMRGILMPAQQTSLTEDEIRRKIIDEAIERLVRGQK